VTIAQLITYVWLFAVLVLLYLVWRTGSTRIMRMQQALIDVSNKSAEAAKLAAEAAMHAVALLEKKHDV
jgi:hypothetical protein